MLANFHWLRPEWLWALPLIALMTVGLARRRLAPGSWQRIIDPALAPFVLSRTQIKGLNYRWWLTLIGGVLATLALAGPSWNRVEQPVFRSEQAVVIALDLSRSMDAQDLTPSRLTRARLKILDILERRQSGQTALVVYSSNAFTVTPLTTDADTVAALVNSLSTDIMPSRGSYPVSAITKSHISCRGACGEGPATCRLLIIRIRRGHERGRTDTTCGRWVRYRSLRQHRCGAHRVNVTQEPGGCGRWALRRTVRRRQRYRYPVIGPWRKSIDIR